MIPEAVGRAINLSAPWLDERDEELVLEVMRSGRLSLGPVGPRFEELLAEAVEARYCATVSSGTAGLHLCMRLAGIEAGDEVITSPYSFVASANCAIYEGATPIFADIDPDTLNLDPGAVEAAIVQIEFFPAIVPAAHTQLRFRFAPGRQPVLVPQRGGAPKDQVRLRDLVYSVEAVPVMGGDPYDLVKGMEDHFGTAYRMVSLSDRYRRMVVTDHHRVIQLRLKLTPRERRELFVHAVRLGDRSGMKLMYHTLARNCTTELVRVIDQTVAYSPWRSAVKNATFFMCSIPTELPHTLRIRGLLADGAGSRMPDLDREMARLAEH